jgi:hypothetical protein
MNLTSLLQLNIINIIKINFNYAIETAKVNFLGIMGYIIDSMNYVIFFINNFSYNLKIINNLLKTDFILFLLIKNNFFFNIFLVFLTISFFTIIIVTSYYLNLYFILNRMIFISSIKQINLLYFYIIHKKNQEQYLKYFKILSTLNMKQYLMGTGIVLFLLSIYITINIYMQIKWNSQVYLTFHFNDIYDSLNISKNNSNFNIINLFIIIFYFIF